MVTIASRWVFHDYKITCIFFFKIRTYDDLCFIESASNGMVFVVRKWRVQILDKAVYISIRANAFGKGMFPTILSPAMVK